MDLERAGAEATKRLQNLVCRLYPSKRACLLIVGFDVLHDCGSKLSRAGVRAAPKRLLREESEESLHEVQPRGVGGCEVEMEPQMTEQPSMDRRRFVRRQIVEDDVHFEVGGNALVDRAQEFDELLRAVQLRTSRDDFARHHVQGSE